MRDREDCCVNSCGIQLLRLGLIFLYHISRCICTTQTALVHRQRITDYGGVRRKRRNHNVGKDTAVAS